MRWIGGAGALIGAATIYAGLEVSYQRFSGLTTEIGVSMIIYFIWAGIFGGFMWKKSMSILKRIRKLEVLSSLFYEGSIGRVRHWN